MIKLTQPIQPQNNPLIQATIKSANGPLLSSDQIRTMQQNEVHGQPAGSVVFPGSSPIKPVSKQQLLQMAKQGELRHMGGPLPNLLKGIVPEVKDLNKKNIAPATMTQPFGTTNIFTPEQTTQIGSNVTSLIEAAKKFPLGDPRRSELLLQASTISAQ